MTMVVTAVNIILDEEEEEEKEIDIFNTYMSYLDEREEHPKIENFFEETVPRFSLSGRKNVFT